MTDELVLTVPLPDSRNASKRHAHWATVYRRTQQYYEACDAVTAKVQLPRAPWPAVLASAVVYPAGLNDEDNLLARLKPLKDWCVKRRIVLSDKPTHWHWRGIPEQIVQRQIPPYVVLTLTRCDAPHSTRRAA